MPKISTTILSYNRIHLLKKTVESYLSTISVPYELFIVDNASTDGCQEYISEVCKNNQNIIGIYLSQNIGGEAFNLGLCLSQSPFVHITENDIEYLPGWDTEILKKFKMFPELGQLSLFSPEPQKERGEIWVKHPSKPISRKNETIFLSEDNVAASSILRKKIFDEGIRWNTRNISHDPNYLLPADVRFSKKIKELGYWVAWNDKYTVINWGHNVKEWTEHLDYYLEVYRAKAAEGEEVMKQRLIENGYDLINKNGKYEIIKKINN